MRPFIGRYIRNLSGIIGVVDSLAPYQTNYGPFSLGSIVDGYLSAHGYIDTAVETIHTTFFESGTMHEFVAALSALGMAASEAKWIWEYIDDN